MAVTGRRCVAAGRWLILACLVVYGCGGGDGGGSAGQTNGSAGMERDLFLAAHLDRVYLQSVYLLSRGEAADGLPLPAVDDTIAGGCGGELTLYSAGQDTVSGDYTVSLTFSAFDDCVTTVSGEIVYSGVVDVAADAPLNATVSFLLFTADTDGERFAVDGDLAREFSPEKSTEVDIRMRLADDTVVDVISLGYGYSTVQGLTFFFGAEEESRS